MKLGLLLTSLFISCFAMASNNRPEACGPLTEEWTYTSIKTTEALPAAPSDRALVVFLNTTKMSNDPIFKIGSDGKWMAATKTKNYAVFAVTPGEHHLCGETGKKYRAVMSLTTEPGKTYFVENMLTKDPYGERRLQLVNPDVALVDIQRFKLAVSAPKN
jgi:hypothetical protein